MILPQNNNLQSDNDTGPQGTTEHGNEDSTNPSLRHFRKLLYGETEPNDTNEEDIKVEIISDINSPEDTLAGVADSFQTHNTKHN